MSDSVQFKGRRRVDLVILSHLAAFYLEYAIDDGNATPGSLGNAPPNVGVVSVVPSVLVLVGHELPRNAESEIRIVKTDVDKALEHGVSFLS